MCYFFGIFGFKKNIDTNIKHVLGGTIGQPSGGIIGHYF